MLRVTTGKYKGKKLQNIDELTIRPTKWLAKEAIFSILLSDKYAKNGKRILHNANILDLCGGSGALGIEALSRGAKFVTFIDNNEEHLQVIRRNLTSINELSNTQLINADIAILPFAKKFHDIVFFDPPYGKNYITPTLKDLIEQQWVHEGSIVICEFGSKEIIEIPLNYKLLDERKYGKTKVIFAIVEKL